MCGLDIIGLAVAAIVIAVVYFIINAIPFFAPFKSIINILFAAIVAIFVILKVIAPLLSCAGL